MAEIFGDFVEEDKQNREYLEIGFSPTSVPLQQRWRNNGLSANFLSAYLSTFFPGEDVDSLDRREEIKSAVNFIANELLENAMKFNFVPSKHPVGVGMYLDLDKIRFYTSNSIDPKAVKGFKAWIKLLLTEDTHELFMKQVMNGIEDKDSKSGLGFLTMMNDYGAKLAWKFESRNDAPEAIQVTVMVNYPL
jgi:hypothetical protein